jgi:hypothetical protein
MDARAGGCHPGPVTPSDDLSPPRRPIFFPVVIATVFLTIIGLTAGFFLGERHRDEKAVASPATEPTQPQQAASPVADLVWCPPATREFAVQHGFPFDLHQVLKVQTGDGTTVWICEDPDQRLYYQGKTGGPDAKLVQNENGLFLPGVHKQGTDEYLAVAHNGNEFRINRTRLQVRFTSGNVETHWVVAAQ